MAYVALDGNGMEMAMRIKPWILAIVAVGVLGVAMGGWTSKQGGNRHWVLIRVERPKTGPLTQSAVVLSWFQDEVLVRQSEAESDNGKALLNEGPYEIRAEGEGMKSIVKRGLSVGKSDALITVTPVPGSGTRVTEYQDARPLTRDELAARVAALEKDVNALKKGG